MANQILAGAVFQAGQVIAGVDADNPPYVGPPQPKSWNFDNQYNHSTYVLVDAHSGMKLSNTSGWTLEFWSKFDGSPGQENIIEWSDGDHISITSWEGGNEWKFNTNTGQNMTIAFDNVGGSFPSLWTTGSNDEWSHVAFVGTPTGSGSVRIDFYLNGVKHPQNYTSSQTYGTAGNTQIGKYLDGSMFDFRMSSTPRYTADFTAPTDLLPIDGNVTLSTLRYETLSDESTYGSSVSVVGDFGVEPVPQENYPFTPVPPPSYTNYSTEYTTLSGGSLVEVTHSGGVHNLNATIDSMTDGDALLLSPGEYEIDGVTDTTDGGNPDNSYTNDYMRMKNIALVGKSDNPSDITVHLREGPATYIDGGYDPIFGAYSGVTSDWLRHFAYLRVVRHTTQTVPYGVALAGYHAGPTKGYAKNVIFDLGGSSVSWRYNNANTSQKVKFEDCSFVNYSEWVGSYSGAAGTVVVEDCAFSGTGNLGDSRISVSGTNIENVTFDYAFNYTPTTSGHLNEATTSSTVSISDPS
jgi:hypothetical protein